MGGNMNIDELTLGQLKQIKSMCGGAKENFEHPYKIRSYDYLMRLGSLILVVTTRLLNLRIIFLK
jgi:hypothetical protein